MEYQDLSEGFWDTIRNPNALELFGNLGEAGIDAITEGPLKEIPIIGSILGLRKVYIQIRDNFFIEKLRRFLISFREGGGMSNESFRDKMTNDEKHRHRVGSNILIAIDRLDDVLKAEYLARAFLNLTEGSITYDTFLEFTMAIERCLIADLGHMKDTDKRLSFLPTVGTRLSACGLVEIHAVPVIRAKGDEGNYYHMTEMGRNFVRYVLHSNLATDDT